METVKEMCGDNRFEVIQRAKEHLLEATNIETSPDEMKVLDSFLFRAWQMEWLRKYDPTLKAGKDTNVSSKWVSVDERLPEESLNSVMGWDEYRERWVFVQYYKGEWILGNHESVKITHWMPLPEPPKEVQ